MPIPTGATRSLLSVDNLTDGEVEALLDRARSRLENPRSSVTHPFVTGLIFQSPSLRTRVGFAVATARLGGVTVEIAELRHDETMTRAESFADTVRTVQGMVDVTVTRTLAPLWDAVRVEATTPIINGGELNGEHPTQALIDLLAIEEEGGEISSLRIGLCGDLGARSARSLVKLLVRRSPASLVLMGPASRPLPKGTVKSHLESKIEIFDHLKCDELDVLYMVGLPERGPSEVADTGTRAAFSLDAQAIRNLPSSAVVLSPMPMIDEISPEVRGDARIRMFHQSDRGVAVRMACLELCLGLSRF